MTRVFVDVKNQLQGLIESKLRAFAALRGAEVGVPAFLNGEQAFDRHGNPIAERVSEASLERPRNDSEKKFLYDITGNGRLIAKDERLLFERLIRAYETQLQHHSFSLRQFIDEQAHRILDSAVELILERTARSGSNRMPDPASLYRELSRALERTKHEVPNVNLVFKDVTYEQTRSDEFRSLVDKALPYYKRRQLGQWTCRLRRGSSDEEARGSDV